MGDRWGMAIQGWTGVSVNKAAEASRQARSMVEGALRAMTGAAAPETEVVRYDALFMPKPWDNQATLVILNDCWLICETQPPTTCPTLAASTPARSNAPR